MLYECLLINTFELPWWSSGWDSTYQHMDTGSIPGPWRSHPPRGNSTCGPQILKPAHSRAGALQQEKPPQWKTRAARWEKAHSQQRRSSAAKINNKCKFKSRQIYTFYGHIQQWNKIVSTGWALDKIAGLTFTRLRDTRETDWLRCPVFLSVLDMWKRVVRHLCYLSCLFFLAFCQVSGGVGEH